MLQVNHLVGFGGTGSRPATATKTDDSIDVTNTDVYTFSAQTLGTIARGRRIVVGVMGSNGSTTTIDSVTVAGNAAVQLVQAEGIGGGGWTQVALFIIVDEINATGDIIVTFSVANFRCGIGVWAVNNLLSSIATDTGSSTADPQNDTLNISAGGVAIGYSGTYMSGSAGSTHVWTNLTEQFDTTFSETEINHSGASDAFAAAQSALSITCNPSAAITAGAMVLAALR